MASGDTVLQPDSATWGVKVLMTFSVCPECMKVELSCHKWTPLLFGPCPILTVRTLSQLDSPVQSQQVAINAYTKNGLLSFCNLQVFIFAFMPKTDSSVFLLEIHPMFFPACIKSKLSNLNIKVTFYMTKTLIAFLDGYPFSTEM